MSTYLAVLGAIILIGAFNYISKARQLFRAAKESDSLANEFTTEEEKDRHISASANNYIKGLTYVIISIIAILAYAAYIIL